MIVSRTYPGADGSSSIFAPELALVRILGVKRNGLGYNVFEAIVPSSRQCEYDPAGFINFDIPFTTTVDSSGPFDILVTEKVFVLWEE